MPDGKQNLSKNTQGLKVSQVVRDFKISQRRQQRKCSKAFKQTTTTFSLSF